MLTEKYTPKKIEEIIGNEDIKDKIRLWILKWLKGEKQRPLLIYGKTGVGKTSMALSLAKEYNLTLIEVSSSDVRNKESVSRKIGGALKASSLFGEMKLILIDDVEGMTSEDRGGITTLSSLISDPSLPIILTTNDLWDKKLSPLRNLTTPIEMKSITPTTVKNHLTAIAEKEKLQISKEAIEEIAARCAGDLRSALNDLEVLSTTSRDRKTDIFEILKIIFKATSLKTAKKAQSELDIPIDSLKLWLSQNIAEEYDKKEDMAKAYDILSRADIFDGRIIRRQYWGFLRYSYLLSTAGVALSKQEVYRKFTRYLFPSYLKEMANTAKKRGQINSIAKKIGKKLHLAPSKIKEFMLLYGSLIEKDEESAKIYYRLDDEDLIFIKTLKHLSNGSQKTQIRVKVTKAKKDKTKE